MSSKETGKKNKRKPDAFSGNISYKANNSLIFNRKNLIAAVVIMVATIVCYLPVFKNAFVNWDDDRYIYSSELIKEINIKAFFSQFVMGNYHPFVITAYALIYKFFGLNPDAFHLVNLIFHLLNTLLVFIVFIYLIDSFEIAFIVSVLFGVHPLHVESVAWASELKDLMYSFFFLTSLWSYLLYVKNNYQRIYYLTALLFFICSLLSKAMGVSLAVVFILVDILTYRRLDKKAWFEKIPFFVIGLVFGYVAIIAQRESGSIYGIEMFTFPQRIVFACYGFLTYIERIFLPVNLSAYYPYPVIIRNGIPGFYYLYPLICIILIGLIVYSLEFTRKIFFAFGFFACTVFLVLQFLPVGRAIMADRYSYLPSIGIFYLIAFGLNYLSEKYSSRIVPSAILVVVILSYGIATFHYIPIWKDSLTLWTDVINKSGETALPYYNRGLAKSELMDYTGALEDYNKAIELEPLNADPYYNRGVAKDKLQDYSGAIQDYTMTIELKPGSADPYNNRGVARRILKDYTGAINDFNKAIEMNPRNADVFNNRGNTKSDINDKQGAIQDYTKAIELNPNHAGAYYNRGNEKYYNKDYTGAIQDYSRAIEINPTDTDAYTNLGVAKILSGDRNNGCADLTRARELGENKANDLIKEYCQ